MKKPHDPKDLEQALAFALEKYPGRVEAVPVTELIMDSARGNPKRPAFVKLAVPDDVVKALRGPAERRDNILLLVSIPNEVLERSESSIILPNEV